MSVLTKAGGRVKTANKGNLPAAMGVTALDVAISPVPGPGLVNAP